MKTPKLAQIKNFYKNKRIIVTGHTGFKGSWLSLWLSNFGAKVMGLSNNIPTTPSHYSTIQLKNKITSKRCDIRNYNSLHKEINKFKPDLIFHLAAQSIVKKSYDSPYITWQTNLGGTINLLEVLKNYTKSKVVAVLITSDKVYKNLEVDRPYKEDDSLGGFDPYSGSKASADIAIQSYVNSFMKNKNNNVLISTARAGNVIGGGDWSEGRLIPDCIRAWSKNKKVSVRNPNSTRPWQHVLEVLIGYMKLAFYLSKVKNLHGQVFNFGPKLKNKFRVIDVLRESKFRWIKAGWQITKHKNKFKESKLLHLNSLKSKKTLKWDNSLSFKESIRLSIEWYKKFYEKKNNMTQISINQINFYQKIIQKIEK